MAEKESGQIEEGSTPLFGITTVGTVRDITKGQYSREISDDSEAGGYSPPPETVRPTPGRNRLS